EDEEETIDAEEALEGEVDHKAELDALEKESELPVEDLLKKYSVAFSDSFETPESDSDDSSDTEEEEDEEDDETTTDDEDEDSSSSTG
ncbi:hypothetical protein scyTo_0026122, partial [Scyliorhinus torazame]|nr:hypothetical protein [Scyliorhinus torazame]